jgi:hypothetical protein
MAKLVTLFLLEYSILATFLLIIVSYFLWKAIRSKSTQEKLLMSVLYKNIDKVPFLITGAVDAEGAPAEFGDATFVWEVVSTNGKDLGNVEVAQDGLSGVFNAGIAGAEGFLQVTATFADGKVLIGKSEQLILTASEAVSFTIAFGEPLP